MKRWLAALVLFPAWLHAEPLPLPVSLALQRAGVPLDAVAVIVRDASGKETLVAHNAAKVMNPASVIKLVTTAAALDLLGPAYTFKTEFYAAGEIKGGVLEGDLIVKGYGDPKLTYERLWAALRELHERGIRDVRGDVVFDRSFFAAVKYDPAQFDGKPRRAYNVGPDALLMNFKTITFRFIPDAQGVSVIAEPPIPSIAISSRIKLVNGACGDWSERLALQSEENDLLATTQFSGAFAASCGEKAWHVSLFDHPHYDSALFRSLWSETGGKLFGKTREGALPQDARLIMTTRSAPLADLVRDINKFSNDVMTRQLFLTIAAEIGNQPGDTQRAAQIIKEWLNRKGIEAPELVLENGSGLSRLERISARSLAGLLGAMWKDALMPELVSSLPLLAVDGTMEKRRTLDGMSGQAHIKTGTLDDVSAIAGYVLDRNGRCWIVVFIANHPNAAASRHAQDVLLEWIYTRA
jgi:serine-type D-Ala-D-Ala carboxypeptidase/endopeptidase (penicillin-binding protein 4)